MIDRKHLKNIDWILIGLLLINTLIGVAFIYSSSAHLPGNYYLRQLFWLIVSALVLVIVLAIDYRYLIDFSLYAYMLLVVILGLNLVFGRLIAGTKSWIRLPFFQIQPSEFMKIVVILFLVMMFSKYQGKELRLDKGFFAVFIVMIPVGLVAMQPDLGTALTYLPILLAVFVFAGINRKAMVIFLILIIAGGIVTWNFGLKDYQKKRLTTVIFPEKDLLGSGYQINQSKIAIGSGGLFGKGFKKGTQSQLRFLPARHTDFIFSVIGEETGFLGIFVSLAVYFLFLTRMFLSVDKTRDRAGAYLIFMVAVMLSAQFFINVAMTIGLFPVAGIPLPLLSYGGSSLLANFIAVAMVLNVKMRRFVNV